MLCEYDNDLESKKKKVLVMGNNSINIFNHFDKWVKCILISLTAEYIIAIITYFLLSEYTILVDSFLFENF